MSENERYTPNGTKVPITELDGMVEVYKLAKTYRIYPKPDVVVLKPNGPNSKKPFTYFKNGVLVKKGTPNEIRNKNTPFDPNRQRQGGYGRGGGYGGRGGYGNRSYGGRGGYNQGGGNW